MINKHPFNTIIISFSIAIFVFFVLFVPVFAQSQETTTGENLGDKFQTQSQAFRGEEGAGVGETQDPRLIIALMIRWVLGIVGIVALGYTIYGGYLILTSRGNEEKIEDGKSTLLTASVGILVILAAYSITNFVVDSLYRAATPVCDYDDPFCTKIEVKTDPQGKTKDQPTDLEPRQEEKRQRWGWSY